jgi:hypothetical protein
MAAYAILIDRITIECGRPALLGHTYSGAGEKQAGKIYY